MITVGRGRPSAAAASRSGLGTSSSMSSVVRATMGVTISASAIEPASAEKWPIGTTTSSYTNRPMMIDGALSRMSLMKRTTVVSLA